MARHSGEVKVNGGSVVGNREPTYRLPIPDPLLLHPTLPNDLWHRTCVYYVKYGSGHIRYRPESIGTYRCVMECIMEETDRRLAQRIRDVIAVATDDIDAIAVAVEDGVAYIEGVVASEQERRAIASAVRRIDGLNRVITCLSTEHILPRSSTESRQQRIPPPVMTHSYSLS